MVGKGMTVLRMPSRPVKGISGSADGANQTGASAMITRFHQ